MGGNGVKLKSLTKRLGPNRSVKLKPEKKSGIGALAGGFLMKERAKLTARFTDDAGNGLTRKVKVEVLPAA